MASLNPYLNFNGNTLDAFNLYKSVFGGEFRLIQHFKDTPEGEKFSKEDGDKIMHISLPIGKNNILMGTDAIGERSKTFTIGNNFSISIDTESIEEADKIFNGLSENGKVVMPMQKTFWGSYFGMLIDPFGVDWMVSFETK